MKERLTMLAWKAHVDGDDAAAVETYRTLAADHPQDKYISYMAGDLLFHADAYEDAIPWLERTIELDPGYSTAMHHLLEALAAVGREDEIVARARRFAEAHPVPPAWVALAYALARTGQIAPGVEWMRRAADAPLDTARWQLGSLLLLAGDYEGAEREFRKMRPDAGTRDVFGRTGVAAAQGYQGKRREALRSLEAIPGVVGPGASLEWLHFCRIEYAMGDGRLDVARASVPHVRDTRSSQSRQLPMNVAYLGDLEAAAALARALVPGSPYDRLHRAVVRWRTGDATGAADEIGAILRQAPWVRFGRWFHAEALFQAGRWEEAVTALAHFHDEYEIDGMYRSWAYPKSLYLLARSYEELGRREKGREEIEKLLAIWKDADPDLPLLADARALRARLAKAEPVQAR